MQQSEKYKSDHKLSEKKQNERGRHSICLHTHMRFKHEAIFQIEIRKIELGIAVIPLVLITTVLMLVNSPPGVNAP